MQVNTPLGGWESSLNATAIEDGSIVGVDSVPAPETLNLPMRTGPFDAGPQGMTRP